MEQPLDLKQYRLNREDMTSHYDLTPEQRDKANYDQAKIIQDLEKKQLQLAPLKRKIEAMHNQEAQNLIPKEFKFSWIKYHSSEAEQTLQQTKKYLNKAHIVLKEENLAENTKEYLGYYAEYFQLLFEIQQLNHTLSDLNLVRIQAKNYRMSLSMLEQALGRANTLLHVNVHANPLTEAWNHWIDANGYHKRAKQHQKIQLSLQHLVRALPQDDFKIAEKTPDVLYAERFIMQTLAQAYDQIDRLRTDYRCCVKLETRVSHIDLNFDLGGFNSGYIRVRTSETNALYYINKRRKKVEQLNPYDFDSLIKPTTAYRWLSLAELDDIKRQIGHDAIDKDDMLFQKNMADRLYDIQHICNDLKHSGSTSLQYLGGLFLFLSAMVVILSFTGLGMYLGGGTAASIVVAALTTIHLYPSLIALASAAGCGMALVTPIALGVGGSLCASVPGLMGAGFWKVGADKNPVSRGARQASAFFLEEIISPQHEQNAQYSAKAPA